LGLQQPLVNDWECIMPKGYWIADIAINDQAAYDAYRALNAPAFKKYGARFLVRGGAFTCVEGETRPRHVVIEFASIEDARACYASPEYSAALAKRPPPLVEATLVIIEGYDGPQP
jgi:uncharacterized protein (DUF1330 family)